MLDGTVGNLYLVELRLTLVKEPHLGVLVDAQFLAGILHVVLIDLGKGGRGADTGILQSRHHIDHVRHVDTARTQTTREEIVAVYSEQCHRLDERSVGRGGCFSLEG